MSERVEVFDQGIIQQISTVHTLYESPENRFVASFVGDCNQMEGIVEDGQGPECAVRLKDGALIRALNISRMDTGAQCVLAVRPERIRIVEQPSQANTLCVQAPAQVYFGDHFRLRCRAGHGTPLFWKLPLEQRSEK